MLKGNFICCIYYSLLKSFNVLKLMSISVFFRQIPELLHKLHNSDTCFFQVRVKAYSVCKHIDPALHRLCLLPQHYSHYQCLHVYPHLKIRTLTFFNFHVIKRTVRSTAANTWICFLKFFKLNFQVPYFFLVNPRIAGWTTVRFIILKIVKKRY